MAMVPCQNPSICGVSRHKEDSESLRLCLLRGERLVMVSTSPTLTSLAAVPEDNLHLAIARECGFDGDQMDEIENGLYDAAAEYYVSLQARDPRNRYERKMMSIIEMTPEERVEECRAYLRRIADNETTNPVSDQTARAAKRYLDELSSCKGLDAEEAYVILETRSRMFAAAKSIEREIRYVAGEYDLDVDDVADRFRQLRASYSGQQCDPRWEDWSATLYRGSQRMKRPPMDDATRYALSRIVNPDETKDLPRAQREIALVDIETTGFNDHQEQICQISVAILGPDGSTRSTYSSFVKTRQVDGKWWTGEEQDEEGRPGAMAVHKITPDMLEDAPTMAEIATTIQDLFRGRTLSAHNLYYDYPRIQRALDECGAETLESPPMIDTLRVSRRIDSYNGEKHRHGLSEVADRYGIQLDKSRMHRADYDVEVNVSVLSAVLRDWHGTVSGSGNDTASVA